jgi:hypothetical protein
MIKLIEFQFEGEIDPDLNGILKNAEIKIERREIKKEIKYVSVRFTKEVPYSKNKLNSIRRAIEADLTFRSLYLDEPLKLTLGRFIVEQNGLPHEIFMASGFSKNKRLLSKRLRDNKGRTFFNFESAYKNKEKYIAAIALIMKKERVFRYLVQSYNSGQLDQDNEFFYLFQIQEALRVYFHPKEAWRKLLMEKNIWDRLSKTTNNRAFMQSRHRGQEYGGKKPAPGKTIRRVRRSAREAILKFMSYLFDKHKIKI